MPNSLKSRLKGLVHKGLLSEKDLSRIYTDNDVIEEIEKIKAELQTEKDKSNNTYYAMKSVGLSTAIKIIDNHISELKGE